MDFSNKVVVITGASAGIGASAAELFAKQSAQLVLTGRNEVNLKSVAAQCEAAKNIKPLTVIAEMTNDEDVKRIVDETIEAFGRIDVLVNNAASGARGSITDGIEPFDRMMSNNVRSVYLLTSIATPHLIKARGNIVNVSSVAAFRPIKDADYLPYCISKAALDQFTKCLALDLGPSGVRVNSVNPGGTRTSFAERAGFSREEVEELYASRAKTYPLRKMAESEDVADLILYLASDRYKASSLQRESSQSCLNLMIPSDHRAGDLPTKLFALLSYSLSNDCECMLRD
ncbi:enoyl-(Acyl carrier protein) reductase domain-containing protein [Phthorimaea operculella]|nr:enoyl-(Acyl carrier protein) reductase domain-containing protein [Phthorimaea operculella]